MAKPWKFHSRLDETCEGDGWGRMQYAFLLLLLASILIGLGRGGQPEKWGAVTLIAMTILQVAGISVFGSRSGTIDWVAFAVDLIGFASFTAIALFARRVWPLWASALQLFSLTTHFVRVLDIHVHPAAYWLMKSAPTFGVCLILTFATVLHRRRTRTFGEDLSWTVWGERRESSPSTRRIRRF